MRMTKAVLGIVETRDEAETVLETLRDNGFRYGDVSLLFPDQQGTHDFAHEHHSKAPEGALLGAGSCGVVGGAIGLLACVGLLGIPGAGGLALAGPLLATLSGSAAGALVGGLVGALVGLGIPEIEAKAYRGKLRGKNILIAVHTENEWAREVASECLLRAGAHDVGTTREAEAPALSSA
jgi:hypothetical protein